MLVVVFVIIGIFFSILPHSIHLSIGLTESHTIDVALGVVSFVLAGLCYYFSKKV
jgi:protein-S-isoprenylcysteine O-methyltransferase Ste14